MKNVMYEHKVDAKDELLKQIFNIARCQNDATVLPKVTLSVVEQVRACIQADSCHFEHLLN
jgi:hypothetical protein